MQAIITNYILVYGYLAIFCVVLLQELGMPGLPNELVLLYFGFISRQSGLSYPFVILLEVLADVLASFILFFLFYYGKEILMRIKPSWLRLPVKKILSLKEKISGTRGRNILAARLTPFVRSYLPVVAGLLQVNPLLYSRVCLLAAVIWSGGWVSAGWLMYIG